MATNQFMENQAVAAQSNPSIISDLVSTPAPSTPSSPPPQQAPAPDPTFQQGSQMAQDLSSKLYGSGFVSGGEKASDSILQQLFQYDQMLEGKYANPFPEVPGYVQNPADMYSAGAGYASGVGAVSGAINSATSGAERSYQTAIAGLLDKFISFAQLAEEKKWKAEEKQLKEKQREEDKKYESYQTELAIAKLVGGYVTLPDGRKIYVPSDTERSAKAKPKYTPIFGSKSAAPTTSKTTNTKTTRPPLEMFDTEINP